MDSPHKVPVIRNAYSCCDIIISCQLAFGGDKSRDTARLNDVDTWGGFSSVDRTSEILGMDKQFYQSSHTLRACDYLSMLGLMFSHVNKRGPRYGDTTVGHVKSSHVITVGICMSSEFI